MSIENYMIYIWLGVFILSIIVEAISYDLISIWFTFGSIFAIIISAIPGIPYYVDIIVFLGVSILSIFFLRPFANKLLKRKISQSNIDEIVSKKGKVIKQITSLEPGEIKINDIIWTALPCSEDLKIKVGSVVKVVSVQGNKLYVKPIDDKEEN